MTAFRRLALTGASGGIGRALAERLAAPGVEMLLTGRDPRRLRAAAEAAEARGAQVVEAALDVADRAALQAALAGFQRGEALDLLLCNAGVTIGLRPGRAPEDPEEARRLWAVNYQSAVDAAEVAIPPMRAAGRGTIGFVSSLAALRPQADLPSYSASKAALAAYGEALRGWLREDGVRVCVIRPGFVTSPMSARHRGFKPLEIPAERAAEKIVRGLERGRAYVSFPWPLVALGWIDARLTPAWASDLLNRPFRAEVAPDERL